MKSVNRARSAKPVSCASLWMPKLNRKPKKPATAIPHALNAPLAHPAEDGSQAHRVKSGNRVLLVQKPLRLKTKHCLTMSNCKMTSKTAPMANVHVAAHVASVVAATAANVKAMPMAT